jgi:hypothetical protein
MSLDGLVLVIAIVAVALKLYLWFSEGDMVQRDVESDSGLRFQAEARPNRTEGVVDTSRRPRLEGDRYV